MLTIQKLVSLLQPEHLQEFCDHLDQSGNTLPLRLVEKLRQDGPLNVESDELCNAIYGDTEEKTRKKFFQLAHYTFRLSAFLAHRYPFYLCHNISPIERLFNAGKQAEAEQQAENLLDIALKIEDYSTQSWVLKFLINLAHIREKRKESIRLQQLLNTALHNEGTLNEIQLYIRENLNFKDKNNLTSENSVKHLEFFSQYHQRECLPVQIMSRYGSVYTLSFLDDNKFYSEEVKQEVNGLMTELDKHSYIIFPFADDILLNIDYLHLKLIIKNMNEDEVMREATRISKKWSNLRFWQNHINTAQIVSLSIQASYFITRYCISYKENYRELIPVHIRESIDETVHICKRMVDQMKEEKDAHVRYINLNNIYCMLLLLCGKDEIKKSISILEKLMIDYQQIPFQKLYDAIFANLIIGYFSIADHNGVNECYRRYEKLTAKKAKIVENDVTIKAFYYASQWITSGREQYREKLKSLIASLKDNPLLVSTQHLVEELCQYYNIPVEE
ncbi:MAG: hypothetical protein K1X56_12230 [Flavobacteriales bacterium]|nr:hypothetical protein [Flavobacteriales bacterium]